MVSGQVTDEVRELGAAGVLDAVECWHAERTERDARVFVAPAEFAARLGRCPLAGRALLADALDAWHRLPRLWARVCAGQVPVGYARQVAQQTRELCAEAAAWVDAEVAPHGRLYLVDHTGTRRLGKAAAAETTVDVEMEIYERPEADIAYERRHVG